MQNKSAAKSDVSDQPRRKRRSPEEILKRIFEAAREEFKRNGYAGATTAAIARNADVTEAQLFRYFGSKSNLFREVVFKPLDYQLSQFFDLHDTAGTSPSREMADLYTSELQRFIGENIDLLTSLVVAQTYDPEFVHGVDGSLTAYFERGASTLTKSLREKPKVDPKLMVRVSFAAVLGCVMFKSWIFPPGLASEEEIRASITNFVMEGVGATYGSVLSSG